MTRYIILVGDVTDHGGRVIGNSHVAPPPRQPLKYTQGGDVPPMGPGNVGHPGPDSAWRYQAAPPTVGIVKFGEHVVACVGDIVSCPLHGNSKIDGANGSGAKIQGREIAVAGMRTTCGATLIASQVMFSLKISRTENGITTTYPLWKQLGPSQPWYNPNHLPDSYSNTFKDYQPYSLEPPDNNWPLPEWFKDGVRMPQVLGG